MTDFDLVVCGAGAAGLAMACAAGQLGLRTLVLDKQAEPVPVAKGELLQPASLASLRAWGAEQRLLAAGAVRLSQLAIKDPAGAPLLSLRYQQLPAGQQWLLAHDYLAIVRALAESVPDSVRIRRGVVVNEALVEDGRVRGVAVTEQGRAEEVRAPLVVAADGIGSRLRKAMPSQASRVDYPHRLVSFDIPDQPAQADELAAHVTRRGLRLRYPLPGGRVRLYVQAQPDELRGRTEDRLAAWVSEVLAETPALADLADPLLANLDRRQILPVSRFLVESLVRPGLALVGEAAHAVHPMAAQGMNSAIADAAELARQLAGVDLTKPADLDAALHRYQEHRLPALAHIDTVSHNAARMITETSPLRQRLGRRMMRYTARNDRLCATTTYNMSGLGRQPLTVIDRLYQFGLLRDPHAAQIPSWT